MSSLVAELQKLVDIIHEPQGISKDVVTMYDYVLMHGESFETAPLDPVRYRKGRLGQCFTNALRRAEVHGELYYVEGFASTDMGMFFHHGWNVYKDPETKTFKVVDVTWSDDAGVEYFGVPFDTRWALKHATNNKIFSFLDDMENGHPIIRGAIDIMEIRAWPKEL